VIVVATEDFELYHGVVGELRDRAVEFTTVEPGDPLPAETSVVIVGPADEVDAETTDGLAGGRADRTDADVADRPDACAADDAGPDDDGKARPAVVRADPADPRRAVDEALALLRGGEGRTVVGIDPGTRPGVAVLKGDVVVAVFQVAPEEVPDLVRGEVENAPDPVVRIGDGARLEGARILNELSGLRVELVDETGTTPYLGRGVRESGDVVAAINIARMEGEVVDVRDVDPTEGELQVIKNRSRERSTENRTITEALARRVATGDLTLEEAIEEHREE